MIQVGYPLTQTILLTHLMIGINLIPVLKVLIKTQI